MGLHLSFAFGTTLQIQTTANVVPSMADAALFHAQHAEGHLEFPNGTLATMSPGQIPVLAKAFPLKTLILMASHLLILRLRPLTLAASQSRLWIQMQVLCIVDLPP